MLLPSADHPVTIEASAARIVVRAGGRVIADSMHALALRESTYPPVHYIPRADIDTASLTPSDTTTYCPYKGDCSYFSITSSASGGDGVLDAAWTYDEPYPAVAQIAGYLAFYPDRVEIEIVDLVPASN